MNLRSIGREIHPYSILKIYISVKFHLRLNSFEQFHSMFVIAFVQIEQRLALKHGQ